MLLKEMTRHDSVDLYVKVMTDKDALVLRELCQKDLFFLLLIVMNTCQ